MQAYKAGGALVDVSYPLPRSKYKMLIEMTLVMPA